MTIGACSPLRVIDEGRRTAPALVLLGPLGTRPAIWDPVAPALLNHHRLLRIDLPGHGPAAIDGAGWSLDDLARDLIASVGTVVRPPVRLCGASFGGMVAMSAALQSSGFVASLVLICTSAQPRPAEAWRTRAETARADGLSAMAPAIVGRWTTPEYARHQPQIITELIRMLRSNHDEGYARNCEAVAAFDVFDRVGEIDVPTDIVIATRDLGLPPAHGHRLHKALPGSTLVEVEAAHIPWLEQPERVAAAIDEERTLHGAF